MKPATLLPILLLIAGPCLSAQANAAELKMDNRWRDFPNPFDNTVQRFQIGAPPGHKLCGPPAQFPLSNGFIVPLETSASCHEFLQTSSDENPSSIRIYGVTDAEDEYETTEDMAARDYYCGNESKVAAELKSISREPAGTVMGGLDTIICTLVFKDGRYKKMALAYLNGSTPEYWYRWQYRIIAHTRVAERERADALFAEIIPLFHFIPRGSAHPE